MIDVNAFIGPYPYRYVPHPDPEIGISAAKISFFRIMKMRSRRPGHTMAGRSCSGRGDRERGS